MKKEVNKKVLAGGVLLLLAIALILIVFLHSHKTQGMIETIGQQETTDNEKLQEELQNVSLYLEQMDETVVTNKEALGSLQGSSEDFFEQSDSLINEISNVEEILNQYIHASVEADNEFAVQIEDVLAELALAREEVRQSQTQIEKMLQGMEDVAAGRQESMEEKFDDVKKQLSETEKEILDAYKKLAEMTESCRAEEQKAHQEQNALLEEAADRLEELLASYTENICRLIESEGEGMQVFIDERVGFLSGQLEELHQQIEGTKADVEGILTSMESKEEVGKEEIKAAFELVESSLSLIQEKYMTTQEEVKSLLLELKQAEDENHSELVAVLGQMETDMEERGQNSVSLLMESMDQLNKSYSASFDSLKSEMTNNFQDIDAGMNEQFHILNENLSSQYESLSVIVNDSDDTLRQYLENSFAGIDNKLQSVFTYVSDGKRLLASALLTKGVSCREDATFMEIYQAILNIPQQTVIDVEKLPGTISYEYHYHTDADGNSPHAERVSGAGGCYTIPIYHVHTGSSAGGGCYIKAVYHSHDSSCYTYGLIHECHTVKTNSHGTDEIGRAWYTWTYSCGATVTGTSGDGYHGHNTYGNVLNCNKEGAIDHYEPGCGKDGNTVEGYRPGCGLSDGQIIKAHIVYDQNGISMMSLEPMETYSEKDDAVYENEYDSEETAAMPEEEQGADEQGDSKEQSESNEFNEAEDDSVVQEEMSEADEDTESLEGEETLQEQQTENQVQSEE